MLVDWLGYSSLTYYSELTACESTCGCGHVIICTVTGSGISMGQVTLFHAIGGFLS